MTPDIVRRLRAATHEAHSELERRLDIFSHLDAPQTRAALVARFAAMHSAADDALSDWLTPISGLDYRSRSRTEHFSRDQSELPVTSPPLPPRLPDLANRHEALGLFYVLEGSTLGGHVIRKQLDNAGIGAAGLSFLDPYGAQSGARWRDFIQVLDRESQAPDASGAIIKGAVAGFAWVSAALCEEDIPA